MSKKRLFAQNGKMKKCKSTMDTQEVWVENYDIDRSSCYNAHLCAGKNCYVAKLEEVFPHYLPKLKSNKELTKREDFVDLMCQDVAYTPRTKRNARKYKRIHSAGDFYDVTYFLKWCAIMRRNPDVHFYAYTKMVSLVKGVRDRFGLPENFTYIFSYGGKEDHLIDPTIDRHSFVFKDYDSIEPDYADASENDLVAIDPRNHRIGLVYHASKAWEKSGWQFVKRTYPAKSVAV